MVFTEYDGRFIIVSLYCRPSTQTVSLTGHVEEDLLDSFFSLKLQLFLRRGVPAASVLYACFETRTAHLASDRAHLLHLVSWLIDFSNNLPILSNGIMGQ